MALMLTFTMRNFYHLQIFSFWEGFWRARDSHLRLSAVIFQIEAFWQFKSPLHRTFLAGTYISLPCGTEDSSPLPFLHSNFPNLPRHFSYLNSWTSALVDPLPPPNLAWPRVWSFPSHKLSTSSPFLLFPFSSLSSSPFLRALVESSRSSFLGISSLAISGFAALSFAIFLSFTALLPVGYLGFFSSGSSGVLCNLFPTMAWTFIFSFLGKPFGFTFLCFTSFRTYVRESCTAVLLRDICQENVWPSPNVITSISSPFIFTSSFALIPSWSLLIYFLSTSLLLSSSLSPQSLSSWPRFPSTNHIF